MSIGDANGPIDSAARAPPAERSAFYNESSSSPEAAATDAMYGYPVTTQNLNKQCPSRVTPKRTSCSSQGSQARDDTGLVRIDSPREIEDALMSRSISRTVSLQSLTTYSFQETSIARRLHRSTCELGYQLACNPANRPQAFNRVFGLTMKYLGSLEYLQDHFAAVLKRSAKESLHVWGAPFIHIGGAGTHYPRLESHGDWTERPNAWNIRSVGPQRLVTGEQGAYTPDAALQINPDFDGIWFDSHDVEGYLAERGIFISPQASFADIVLPTHDIGDATTPDLSDTSTPTISSTSISTCTDPSRSMTTVPQSYQYDVGSQPSYDNVLQYTQPLFATNTHGFPDDLVTRYMNGFIPPHPYMSERSTAGAVPLYSTVGMYNTIAAAPNANPTPPNASLLHNGFGYTTMVPPPPQPPPQPPLTKTVTIDVGKFITDLGRTSRCLGRTPGFRRSDVDRALRGAIVQEHRGWGYPSPPPHTSGAR
ncbi:hypothetical protein MBLNU459_g5704t1 [Dothideomycetes sp. NU459]